MEHFMEYPKPHRGGGQRRPASRNRMMTALALAGALALPGLAQAQAPLESCGGSLFNSFIAPTPPTPRFIGETLRVRATVTNATVGASWAVDSFEHKLDCKDGGNFDLCIDDGAVMQYVGNITTTCQDVGNVNVT